MVDVPDFMTLSRQTDTARGEAETGGLERRTGRRLVICAPTNRSHSTAVKLAYGFPVAKSSPSE